MCKKTALRKLLSYVLAIVMVLSLASFPAFAEETGGGAGGGGSGAAGGGSGIHTVTLNIMPAEISADATIRVQGSNGTDCEAEADGRTFLLDDGEYMYTIRAEGYLTKMGMFTVDRDITETITLDPTPSSMLRLNKMGQDHFNGNNTGGPGGTKRDMEVEGSGYVGWLRPVAWIKYANVNLLGGIQQYAVNYAIDGTGSVNLGFDVRVANTGSTFDQAESVGSLTLTQRTGGWGSPGRLATQTDVTSNKNGVCDLYVVFTSGEYNFGWLDLTLKPETGGIKEYDLSFKVRPYDAEVAVEDLEGNACEPTTVGGKTYRLEEAFYRYTVSKQGYESKTVLLPADSSKTIMTVLLPEGADTYDRYEAEDGVITGGEVIDRAEFSLGNGVGSFATSNSLGSLNSTFSNISNVRFTVNADTTGIAEIIITYNSSVNADNQDRIAIKSNDGTAKEVYLNPDGQSTAFVDLRAGTNTIYVSNVLDPRITNGGNAWLDLDCIDVNAVLVPGSVEPGELDAPYVQPNNPIVKSIFTADPEAHVWPTDPNKLYLYPSHDMDPPRGCDLMDRYHVFSTENMVDWVDEGEILRADDFDWGRSEGGFMWAPDAAYKDGYYYFYWPHPTGTNWGATWETGVRRSLYPYKDFEEIVAEDFPGYIVGAGGDGMIDVKVFVDDDGEAYIYIGGSQRLFQGKLKDDMITLDGPLTRVDSSVVPSYHEGPSVFKRNGTYYLIYPGGSASSSGYSGDKFNYCTSDSPLGPWEYRGYFFNPTNCDTSHGSIVEFRDKWYFFYHTQDLSNNGTIRSVCVDEVIFNEDGTIRLLTKTLDSVEQNGPDYEKPQGNIYDASIAEIGGGAVRSRDASASNGGEIITDLHLSGSFAEFDNVDGGDGGRANIVIHYSTPDRLSKMRLFVNGVDWSLINMPSTGGRSFFTGEANFTVKSLNPGETNTIRLEGGNSRVNLDYIEVIPFDESVPPPLALYSIKVETDGNGTAEASAALAAEGEEITLRADADNGYRFKEWQVTSPEDLTIDDNIFSMPDARVVVKAIFEEFTASVYSISLDTDGNGVAFASTDSAAEGTEITLSALPDSGYHFMEWQVVSPEDLTIDGNTFTMPGADVIIKAVFEENSPFVYSIRVDTDGNGVAFANADSAAEGTEITLSALPDSGYHFMEWQVISPEDLTIDGNTFTMPGAEVDIKAIFEENPPTVYSIRVDTDGKGVAFASPDSAAEGMEITLSAEPNSGYKFSKWQVISPEDLKIVNNKFIMPDEEVVIKAIFKKRTSSHSSSGSTTPLPSELESKTLKITADNLMGGETRTLKSDMGNLIIPGNMLAGFAEAIGKAAEITISEGDPSDLPSSVRTAIGDRPLIQLTLKLDGKPADWNNPDAPVTVAIPYEPTSKELVNPESIVIWYIDGSGDVVSVPNGHYDPATGTVTFTTTHFSYFAVSYNKISFSDVASTAWYQKAVSFIAARDITTGTGGDSFSPDAKLTRGQFLVMLMKAYEIAADSDSGNNFSDAGNTYYTGYLAAAKQLGITAGVGGNLYAPEKQITRQEMFTLLYNVLKVIGKQPQGSVGKSLSSFSDAGQVAAWAEEAMNVMTVSGTVSGSDGKLLPASTTTRAEMAQVLYNLLDK